MQRRHILNSETFVTFAFLVHTYPVNCVFLEWVENWVVGVEVVWVVCRGYTTFVIFCYNPHTHPIQLSLYKVAPKIYGSKIGSVYDFHCKSLENMSKIISGILHHYSSEEQLFYPYKSLKPISKICSVYWQSCLLSQLICDGIVLCHGFWYGIC